MLNRRGIIGAIGAAIVAPAVIRTEGLLMPIKVNRVPFWDFASTWPHGILYIKQGGWAYLMHLTPEFAAAGYSVSFKTKLTEADEWASVTLGAGDVLQWMDAPGKYGIAVCDAVVTHRNG